MREFYLTRPCSVLESVFSRSTGWNIDLKVLQRAGLLAGREAEWTISSANKSRQRRLGAESSITGNKKRKNQNVFGFFPPLGPHKVVATCYTTRQPVPQQVCAAGNIRAYRWVRKPRRQQGKNTQMSNLNIHTRSRKCPQKTAAGKF